MRNAFIASVLVWGLAAPAMAQSELDQGVAALGSTSVAEVRGGLEQLGLLGNARAVGPISDRIRRGLPADLLGVAVDTLMILGRREAGPILFEMMNHRRSDIRVRAVQAIVACQPRGAERVLIEGLSDTDPVVRSSSAEGLGATGARGAVDALFHAMERRVPGAAMAIAQVARAADVGRFLETLGQQPFDGVTAALSEMLHRADLAASAKLSIIHRLTELATPEVRQFLEDLVVSADSNVPQNVLQAAQDAIPRIGQ